MFRNHDEGDEGKGMKLHFTKSSDLTVEPVGEGRVAAWRAAGPQGGKGLRRPARSAMHWAGELRPCRLTFGDFVAQQLLTSNSISHF